MLGAIIGDMVGAPYEFDRGSKSKEFEMWIPRVHFTDDTVMTIAVAEALLSIGRDAGEEEVKKAVIEAMQDWGERYPYAGYGGRFSGWLLSNDPKPYNSWGNGSAMRVSSVGWLYESLERTLEVARWTAEVTHNHPEGVKGAEATASAIFLARTGSGKEEIKRYIVDTFNYDLSRTCDQIRPTYHHVESCQETVPEAITAFLEGEDFEDVIRTAVSLGGDCDTLTCIAGGIAEAFYGVPADMEEKAREKLKYDIREVLDTFQKEIKKGKGVLMNENIVKRNELLAQKVIKGLESRNMSGYYAADKEEALKKALELIPAGSSVTMGGCMSAHEIGLVKALKSDEYNFIDRDAASDKRAAMLAAYDADVFLSSANAMTDDGVLVNIDGNSNRVSAIAQGPKKVVFIVGMNKVCSDIDAAMKRARNVAAPINAQRFGLSTPCAKTGACMNCKSPDTICCQFLITRFSRHKDRIHVILVNDDLGF